MAYVTDDCGFVIEIENPQYGLEKTIPNFAKYDKVLTYKELDHLMDRLNSIGKVYLDKNAKDFFHIDKVYITKLDKDKYVVQIYKLNDLVSGAFIYCSSSEKPGSGIPILASVKRNIDRGSAVSVDIADWNRAKNIRHKYLDYESVIDLME